MDEKNILFNQYKLFVESKEKFADRSFQANKFYLTVLLLNFVAVYFVNVFDKTPQAVWAIGVLCILGLFISVMWWLNNDTYGFLVKIKMSKVIEVMEEELPYQPFKAEYEQIQDQIKKRNAIVFSDVQKYLTALIFLLYVIILIYNTAVGMQ